MIEMQYVRPGLRTLFIATAALALSACGGGGDGDNDPANTPDNTPEPVAKILTRPNNPDCIAPASSDDVATQLSGTGCFSSTDTRQVVEGVIPYTVNNLLWSDGEKKGRFFAIPDDAKITLREDAPILPDTGARNGDFDFPTGSVIIKHFFNGPRIVETRLLMKHANEGWKGYAYEWNTEQTDATLLTGTDAANGKQTSLPHYFPSRTECMECHTGAEEEFTGVAAARVALGPDTLQLNYALNYTDGSSENFLDALDRLGFFSTPLTTEYKQAKLVALNDTSASVEDRVRSYLHGNCSGCHRTGGPAGGMADLRYNTSFKTGNVCGVTQGASEKFPNNNIELIKPGNASQSALFLRINLDSASTDAALMMPPVGRATIDNEAALLIESWINSLSSCSEVW